MSDIQLKHNNLVHSIIARVHETGIEGIPQSVRAQFAIYVYERYERVASLPWAQDVGLKDIEPDAFANRLTPWLADWQPADGQWHAQDFTQRLGDMMVDVVWICAELEQELIKARTAHLLGKMNAVEAFRGRLSEKWNRLDNGGIYNIIEALRGRGLSDADMLSIPQEELDQHIKEATIERARANPLIEVLASLLGTDQINIHVIDISDKEGLEEEDLVKALSQLPGKADEDSASATAED